MSQYTIKINGGSAQTLIDLGIEWFQTREQRNGVDVLKMRSAPVDLNGTAALEYGDNIELLQDGARVFRGTCTTNPVAGMPGQIERREFLVENIIRDFNRCVYEQSWHEDDSNTYFKGRAILGRDINDNRITLGAALQDIFSFAINSGVGLAYQLADLAALTMIPPDSEVVDFSCWEAARRLLHWAPDISVWIDYAPTTPTVRFTRRADASARSFDYGNLKALTIHPRNDLKVDGVVLTYERMHDSGGSRWTTYEQDTAGDTSGSDVLKQTIDLEGIYSSVIEQQVDVVVDDDFDATESDFWTRYVPGLSQVTDIEITSGTSPIEMASFPNILLGGHVAEWMDVDWAEGEFTAKISGTLNGKTLTDEQVAVKLTLTDAITKTYTQITSSSYRPEEPAPSNLADDILASRGVLHYQGAFTVQADDPDFSLNTGQVVNLTGGQAGWGSMSAVIDSITHTRTADDSITVISIGPPSHLGPQDFVEMIRATRELVTRTFSRSEPVDDSEEAFGTGGGSPNANGALLGGGGLPAIGDSVKNMSLILVEKDVEGETVLTPEWGWKLLEI